MKTSEFINSNYLQSADLKGRNVTLTISHYEEVEMQSRGGGRKQLKAVLFFQRVKKGLVLNVTNMRAIEHVYGDEMDDWAGKPIVLFPKLVDFGGEEVWGIRVRVPRAEQATAPAHVQASHQAPAPPVTPANPLGEQHDERNPPPRGDMDDDIPF